MCDTTIFPKCFMTPKVKCFVDHLIYECDISLQKKIEKKIHMKFKDQIGADPNGVMPTLDKIQNYVRFLRRQ
jgi:hypothetical protein